jgi:glycosyltransferase involved in cell wall biosynthesis
MVKQNSPGVGILSTYPPQKCGIATYTKYLADELKSMGGDIDIIKIEKPDSWNPFYFLNLARKARSCGIVCVQHEYGLFSANSFIGPYFYNLPVLFLCLRFPRKCKIVTILHTVNKRSLLAFFLPNFFMMRFSDNLIVHTKTAKRILIDYGVCQKKIYVIPHGVYTNSETMNKDLCKEKLGLKGKTVLMSFGFISRWKNYRLIIDALPFLGIEVRYLIAGCPRRQSDTLFYKKLIKYAKQRNVLDRVIFYGYVEEEKFSEVFNASDIAILCNTDTTQSGSLNTILAFDVPVLAPDLDYFREIKKHYNCIELYDKDSKDSLISNIHGILNNIKTREYLKNNSELYRKDLNWKEIAIEMKKCFEA